MIARLFRLGPRMVNGAEKYTQLILNECRGEQINSDLIRAIVTVESAFNPNAMRYEKNFVDYWKLEQFAKLQNISIDTEKQLQKFSFGLGQVMGGTARWLGYSGFLTDLCDPSIGLQWMIKYFQKKCSKYVYTNDKIASYNAGSVRKDPNTNQYFNQDYVDHVLSALDNIQSSSSKVWKPS